jgi:hypothetical protein
LKLQVLKSAAKGFIICVILTTALCVALYILANQLSSYQSNAQERIYAADDLRRFATELAYGFSIVLFVYWFLSAAYGEGSVASVKWANLPLAASGLILLLIVVGVKVLQFDTLCDQFPQSHRGFSIFKIAECPSSGTALYGLQFLMLILTVHSLLYRIVKSREIVNSK